MGADLRHDLKALTLGVGVALVLYYGLAAVLVMGGHEALDRPVTWMGLAAGLSTVLVALPDAIKMFRRMRRQA